MFITVEAVYRNGKLDVTLITYLCDDDDDDNDDDDDDNDE